MSSSLEVMPRSLKRKRRGTQSFTQSLTQNLKMDDTRSAGLTNRKSIMKDLSGIFDEQVIQYQVALKQADLGLQHNPGPWTVAEGVQRIIFDAWAHTVPAVWKIAFRENGGVILLYGDPYPVHGIAAIWFLSEIPLKLDRVGGESLRRAFLYPSESGFDIPGYGNKTPDFAMRPRFQRGLRLPSLAVEVGYHGERSFEEVQQETRLWSSAGCGIAVGLKISDQTGEIAGDPRLQLVHIIRGSNEEITEFGHGSQCVSPGTHFLHLPLALLSRHARPLPQFAAGSVISLDLYFLRQDIIDQLVN